MVYVFNAVEKANNKKLLLLFCSYFSAVNMSNFLTVMEPRFLLYMDGIPHPLTKVSSKFRLENPKISRCKSP